MTELENKINNILEEHQHESGLHMIGGRRRLIDRLVQFFEEGRQTEAQSASRRPSGSCATRCHSGSPGPMAAARSTSTMVSPL